MCKLTNSLYLLACLSCAVLSVSCSTSDQQDTPMKIGINQWTGYDPFILADKKDFFKKNNVQVELKRYHSTQDVMQGIRNGEIHGAGLTLDEVFTLIETGVKGKVVMVIDYSTGGDMIIGQKDIKSIEDLRGGVVGYEGSVVGEFLLYRALQQSTLSRRSVKLVDVKANDWLHAFKEKRVDALVCFNPFSTTLLEEYEGNMLYSSAHIPFEIIDVLFISERFYKNNKTAITNMLRAWFDAQSYLDKNPKDAIKIISAAKNSSTESYRSILTGITAPDIKANKIIMDPKSDKNIYKYSQKIVNFMLEEGLISKRVNTTEIFQLELLSEIEDNSVYQQRK